MLVIMVAAFTACHTNEENYKKAYDLAMAKAKESVGAEEYEKVKAEQRRFTTVINGDSVRMIRKYCNIVDGKPDEVQRYSIIVAEFKQITNAKSYRDRLRENDGLASYVVYNSNDKTYCVVAQGFPTKEEAAQFIKEMPRRVKTKIMLDLPWILDRI